MDHQCVRLGATNVMCTYNKVPTKGNKGYPIREYRWKYFILYLLFHSLCKLKETRVREISIADSKPEERRLPLTVLLVTRSPGCIHMNHSTK